MKLICTGKYLILPVNRYAQTKNLGFYRDGELVFDLDIALDSIRPDFEACVNIERFSGMELELRVDPRMDFSVRQADRRPRGDDLYREAYRPGFHYSAAHGWLNDPNGLVFCRGTYHLFYQHNPAGCEWGNMHWGHAESTDLIHWRELDCALYPDRLGPAYSGSGAIDAEGRAGFGQDAVLLFYTAAGGKSRLSGSRSFTQCLAYSVDGAGTFRTYDGNPILDTIEPFNRDPRVTVDERSGCAVMVVFLTEHTFALLRSEDFIHWRRLQTLELEGDEECPDFYPLPLDGDPGNIRWVFSGAHGRYLVGRFDGNAFTAEAQGRLEYGHLGYAAQTWRVDGPGGPGRVRIAWHRYALPKLLPFNLGMTFPCELSLRTLGGAARVCANPAGAIRRLYRAEAVHSDLAVEPGGAWSAELNGRFYDIGLTMALDEHAAVDISLFGLTIRCDAASGTLQCQEQEAPLCAAQGRFRLRLLVDTTSLEAFIGEGEAIISFGFLMDYNINRIEIAASGERIRIEKAILCELSGIWENEVHRSD